LARISRALGVSLLALAVGSLGAAGIATAQRGGDYQPVAAVYLDDVAPAPGGERVVDLFLRVQTQHGEPARGVRPTDLEVFLDDGLIDPEDLTVQTLLATGQGFAAVLAIDASGSMRDKFDHAKEAAREFLTKLRPQDQLAIVAFADDVRVVADFSHTRDEANRALRELEIDKERSQQTHLYDGAHKATQLIRGRPGLPRRTFVIVFSDGQDQGSDRTHAQVVEAAAGSASESHILVYTLGYARFGGEGLEELAKLAEATGGHFIEFRSLQYLRDFLGDIANQVLHSYVVRFPSSMDGDPHRIRVKIEGVASSERTVAFPAISGPIWPWVLGAGILALAAAVVFAIRGWQRPGRIAIQSGAKAGVVVRLHSGKNLIGALEDNDIVLPSDTVGRHHAEINVRGKRVDIVDLNSLNGTRVNGQAIERAALAVGDKIRIADIDLVYER
jgi:VWFA-related protein